MDPGEEPGCPIPGREGRHRRRLSAIDRRDIEAAVPTGHPPTKFNYPVDICGKWHGTRYRFIQRYRSGFPENLGDEFDAPFTRLDWISHDRFDLQWHRHTGEWFCLHRGLSLIEAMNTIIADGLLHRP
jgi:hypothetical protein